MSDKERAIELFKHGHNCAQAVICAYTGTFQIDDELAFRLSEGFGGGFGGTGSICGALSGMVMVASLAGCPEKNLQNPTKKVTYPLVKKLINEFEEKNEYVNCRDILNNKDMTLVDGKKKGCLDCVALCCDLIEKHIINQ